MRPAHLIIRYTAPLLALAAAGTPQPVRAQDNAGISSGSGSGTGTGASSVPDYRPVVPLGEPASLESPDPRGPQPPVIDTTAPLGPGVNVRFPDDPSIAPFLFQNEAGRGGLPGGLRITPQMIDTAKLISEPGERGRILLQIARGAILSNQLVLAHRATEEAATAATHEQNELIHDQLIISIVTTAGLLSDSLLREAKPQVRLFPDETDDKAGPRMAGDVAIRTARLEWRRAAYMAAQIRNPTYRSEYLDRAVENMAVGSAIIALEYATPVTDDRGPKLSDEDRATYAKQADDILEEGATTATTIERPIWRNRAMERLATAAGESGQYERATELANRIKNAEARARAMILVAEFQARKGRNDDATRSFNLAAEAVASVQQRGLRGVLAGILVDSLISTGRFEDARATLILYPSDAERFVAMGAIAESLGLRRMADEARAWIDSDVPVAYRSTLYRRLNNGLLRAISEARAREFQGRDFPNATRTE